MPVQMYTRLLSAIAYCASGCWFTQEMSLCVSVDDTDEGRTDIWDKWRPSCVTGDRAAVNKLAALELLILYPPLIAVLHRDHVNSYNRACGLEELHGRE